MKTLKKFIRIFQYFFLIRVIFNFSNYSTSEPCTKVLNCYVKILNNYFQGHICGSQGHSLKLSFIIATAHIHDA